MTERPYAALLHADFGQMISRCIAANDEEGLLKIRAELCHRNSAGAKRLRAQLGKDLAPVVEQHSKNPLEPKLTRPRLGPHEVPILELERLAETAMHRNLVSEVQKIDSLLTHRRGHRVKNLKNRIVIYLWEQGLKPDLLPR